LACFLFYHPDRQLTDEVGEMASVTGIGSGLDINSIVKALVDAERAPKEAQLARLEKATTSKFSALGQFKSAISELQTVLKDLNKTSLFEGRTATSSDAKLLTASATKEAVAGSYQIKINTLASASKVASREIASGTTAQFNTGKLDIKVGGASVANVTVADGATLSQIRDAINIQAQSQGVTASLITDPGDNSTRLVLSSTKTGANQHVTVDVTDLNGGVYAPLGGGKVELDQLAISSGVAAFSDASPDAGYITAPGNASLEIDGVSITSTKNEVSGAIPGVTLNLLGQTEAGKTVKVDVALDRGSVKTNIKKFVDTYNKMIGVSAQVTNVTKVGEDKAPVAAALVGDATVRSVLSSVRNELVAPADQQGIRVLADLGISTQKDGTLKIDDTKLDKALTDNFASLTTFFTGDNGLMKRLEAKVDGFVRSGGVLDERMKGLQSTLSNVDKQREALNLRIQQVETRLFAQFNAMDSLVGQLNQTSQRLTQALGSLPGVVKQDK